MISTITADHYPIEAETTPESGKLWVLTSLPTLLSYLRSPLRVSVSLPSASDPQGLLNVLLVLGRPESEGVGQAPLHNGPTLMLQDRTACHSPRGGTRTPACPSQTPPLPTFRHLTGQAEASFSPDEYGGKRIPSITFSPPIWASGKEHPKSE